MNLFFTCIRKSKGGIKTALVRQEADENKENEQRLTRQKAKSIYKQHVISTKDP